MVIVGPRREHNVGLPLSNGSNDLPAHLEGWQQFSIMIAQDLVFGDSEAARGLLCFRITAPGERAAALLLMAGISIGDGKKFHCIAGLRKLRGGAGEFAIAVVRVGADSDDSKNATIRLTCQPEYCQVQNNYQQ